ncbi:MAG: hypothetical protein JWO38_3998 [Gemmataceae bacterium]|nr:hypothetical protein [Gemmataceae bacterium]
MFVVTMEEAREHLAELIAQVAAGRSVVISDRGKAVAELVGPPMFPTTPEEIAATQPERERLVREWQSGRADAPLTLPPGMTFQDFLDQCRGRE